MKAYRCREGGDPHTFLAWKKMVDCIQFHTQAI